MNAKLIALSLIAAACGAVPAHAAEYPYGEVGYIPPVSVPESNLTRAEVLAELQEARRAGTLPVNGEGADTGVVAAPSPQVVEPQPTMAAR